MGAGMGMGMWGGGGLALLEAFFLREGFLGEGFLKRGGGEGGSGRRGRGEGGGGGQTLEEAGRGRGDDFLGGAGLDSRGRFWRRLVRGGGRDIGEETGDSGRRGGKEGIWEKGMGIFFGFFVFLGGGGGFLFEDVLERELTTKGGEVQGRPS